MFAATDKNNRTERYYLVYAGQSCQGDMAKIFYKRQNKHSHNNGIESFWAFAKTRIVRFRELQKHTFIFT
jgi:hypothetical protein